MWLFFVVGFSKVIYTIKIIKSVAETNRYMIESKQRLLSLILGWVTTRVRSSKNLATHTRVADQPFSTVPKVRTLPKQFY